MTSTRLGLPQFLRFSERRSLSMQLMIEGLIITIIFISIALLAPILQAWGWLQNLTASLIPPSVNNSPNSSNCGSYQ